MTRNTASQTSALAQTRIGSLRRRCRVLWVACLVLTACGSSSDPTSPNQLGDLTGNWNGTTAQGETISFSVAESGGQLLLTDLELTLDLDESSDSDSSSCLGRSTFTLTSNGLRHPFSGRSFELLIPGDVPGLANGTIITGSLLLRGEIENSSRASGSLTAQFPVLIAPQLCPFFFGETDWVAGR